MHDRVTVGSGAFIRVVGAVTVALLLGLLVAQATGADTPNGNVDVDWSTRADLDIHLCNAEGGTAEMDFITDAGGNIAGVYVDCSFPPDSPLNDWVCTESVGESSCVNPASVFPAPTVSTTGPRAPISSVLNPGAVAVDQPTPTPLPRAVVDTLQNRTTAEMDRCIAQGGTPTRRDTKVGDDLHETLVRCQGGGQDGTICLNTSTGANCQAGTGQAAKQPVLKIQNPGRTAPTPTTAATHATLSLQPVTTQGTAAVASPTTATPPSNTGNRTVIGGIAVKPGPAKLPPEDNSAIYVSAWTCPVTVTPTSSLDQLKGACKDLHNTDFELTGTGVVTSFPKGDIAKSGLPAGQYTIRELIPDHYGLGPTYCTFVPTGSPPPTVWTAAYNEYDGYYEFALGDSQTVYCDWFNFLEVPATPTPTPTPKPGTTVINGSNAGLKPEVTTAASTPTS